jgi:hypothetical protein
MYLQISGKVVKKFYNTGPLFCLFPSDSNICQCYNTFCLCYWCSRCISVYAENPIWRGRLGTMEQRAFKNVNNCLNTSIYTYFETSGGQSYNIFLDVVHFFNNSVIWTSVAAWGSCFPALVSITCCSIVLLVLTSLDLLLLKMQELFTFLKNKVT